MLRTQFLKYVLPFHLLFPPPHCISAHLLVQSTSFAIVPPLLIIFPTSFCMIPPRLRLFHLVLVLPLSFLYCPPHFVEPHLSCNLSTSIAIFPTLSLHASTSISICPTLSICYFIISLNLCAFNYIYQQIKVSRIKLLSDNVKLQTHTKSVSY